MCWFDVCVKLFCKEVFIQVYNFVVRGEEFLWSFWLGSEKPIYLIIRLESCDFSLDVLFDVNGLGLVGSMVEPCHGIVVVVPKVQDGLFVIKLPPSPRGYVLTIGLKFNKN